MEIELVKKEKLHEIIGTYLHKMRQIFLMTFNLWKKDVVLHFSSELPPNHLCDSTSWPQTIQYLQNKRLKRFISRIPPSKICCATIF